MGDGRYHDEPRTGAGPLEARMLLVLRGALQEADRQGVSRKRVARLLGVSPETLGSWVEPNSSARVKACVLFELMVREDVLPESARAVLVRDLCAEAGYGVDTRPAGAGGETLGACVHRMVEELGDVSRALQQAAEPGSEDGAGLGLTEARGVVRELTELGDQVRAAQELALRLEREAARPRSQHRGRRA